VAGPFYQLYSEKKKQQFSPGAAAAQAFAGGILFGEQEMPIDTNMRVLIVDDFPAMRKLIRNSLNEIGLVKIVEAVNGEEAVGKLEREKIDLVISDWNMPVMNGLQLLVHVRTSEELKGLPFIMLTAEGMKDHVVQAIKAGVSNYVVKPFTTEILEAKLKQIFG
jgi:two-component system chemotaxis response regulator CheY